ncbi:MAG: hypothetical protein HQM06_14980 [Magnetococcales bacterium]|nr:hypothetical protein [Magnetococcales bacterium]
MLVTLVEVCEAKRWPVKLATLAGAIAIRMEQRGLSHQDLESLFGSRSQVSAVLVLADLLLDAR